jgi:hypothetical protein
MHFQMKNILKNNYYYTSKDILNMTNLFVVGFRPYIYIYIYIHIYIDTKKKAYL